MRRRCACCRRNGCEVVVPEGQGCCGALHLHAGMREEARKLARRNIDAILAGGFDAIITNAAGCGSTLKEYGELLEDLPEYAAKAKQFSGLMRDITEFLSGNGAESEDGPRGRGGDVSGFLPPGARAEGARYAAPVAGGGPGRDVSARCRVRYLLRQRGHVQRGAERNGDADPASTRWRR